MLALLISLLISSAYAQDEDTYHEFRVINTTCADAKLEVEALDAIRCRGKEITHHECSGTEYFFTVCGPNVTPCLQEYRDALNAAFGASNVSDRGRDKDNARAKTQKDRKKERRDTGASRDPGEEKSGQK